MSHGLHISGHQQLSSGHESMMLEDWSEMSYYCENCGEDLGSVSAWAERHRSLGHSVIGFPLIL